MFKICSWPYIYNFLIAFISLKDKFLSCFVKGYIFKQIKLCLLYMYQILINLLIIEGNNRHYKPVGGCGNKFKMDAKSAKLVIVHRVVVSCIQQGIICISVVRDYLIIVIFCKLTSVPLYDFCHYRSLLCNMA